MEFERRAERAFDRGESARAVITMVEGVKRHPERTGAAERLVDFYLEGVETPGLERDVASALVTCPAGERLLRRAIEHLRESGRSEMARGLRREAGDAGIAVDRGDSAGAASVAEQAVADSGGAGAQEGEPTSEEFELQEETGRSERAGDRREPTASGGGGRSSGAREHPVGEGEHAARGWSRRAGVAAVLTLLVAAAGWWIYHSQSNGSGAGSARIGDFLRSSDPELEGTNGYGSWAKQKGLSQAEIAEGRAFLRSVRALEAGRTVDLSSGTDTVWGRCAKAVAALSRGEREEALRRAVSVYRNVDEHTAGAWLRGRVAEIRGEWSRARQSYRKASEMAPSFVPALTGRIRIAMASLSPERMRKALDALEERRPDHGYLKVAEIRLPEDDPVGGETRGAGEGTGRPDEYDSEFLAASARYSSALRALDSRAFGEASERAARILEALPRFGPAIWVRAAAAAARLRPEKADRRFEHLLELPTLGLPYRWHLAVVAPEMLTGAGRPDLGARYVLPGSEAVATAPTSRRPGRADARAGHARSDAGSRESGSPTSVSSRLGRWSFDAERAPVEREVVEAAHLARLRVAMQLGRFDRVRRWLERTRKLETRGPEFDLFRAEFRVMQGQRPAGPSEWHWRQAEPASRLVDAFYTGRYEDALGATGQFRKEVEGSDYWRIVRIAALSRAATGRGRRALQMLAEADLPLRTVPGVRHLRWRILARLGRGRPPEPKRWKRLRDLRPTGIEVAVDLAAFGIWTHRLDAARRWSRTALRRAPVHPESNWVRGIALRMDGRVEKSETFLQHSWRGGPGRARLSLELGYVHLAEGNIERARELFYQGLLAEPESLEAIRGLGRAYLRLDRGRGEDDFEGMLENYVDNDDRAVQAAEVLRWLAVYRGIRRGAEEAVEPLRRARDLAGDRARLLLEMARFRRANDELDAAKSLFIESLARDSTLAPAHLGLAKIAASRNNTQSRREHLRQYLDLQPRGAEAKRARSTLESLGSAAADR